MSVAPTYPGVYVEELPNGPHTISSVASAVTAFIGRAERGPVDDPMLVSNFGEFTRTFGDLRQDMPLGYAVSDFFMNGGSLALIVRLWKDDQRIILENILSTFKNVMRGSPR